MKICLVAPGIMPIPPTGWGAVEMMLWDYYQILKEEHEVKIINERDRVEILRRVHSENFDVVHIHYDVFVDIADKIFGPKVIMSSHYPFISDKSKYRQDSYDRIFPILSDTKGFHIFASSKRDIDTFVSGGSDPKKVHLSRLGIRKDDYKFDKEPQYDKTICFSQIVDRKRQYLIQNLEDVVFSGRLDDNKFISKKNYLGELSRDILNKELTKYSNFVLLSKTENTTPLAVKEAMLCGLGVVVSKEVAHELDEDLPFVEVLTENQVHDTEFVNEILEKNRKVSRSYRHDIREYALQKFDLNSILKKEYIPKLREIALI